MHSQDEQHLRDTQNDLAKLTFKLNGMASLLHSLNLENNSDELSTLLEGLRDEAQNIYNKIDPVMWPSKVESQKFEQGNWAEP
jgi:hypothetical protein